MFSKKLWVSDQILCVPMEGFFISRITISFQYVQPLQRNKWKLQIIGIFIRPRSTALSKIAQSYLKLNFTKIFYDKPAYRISFQMCNPCKENFFKYALWYTKPNLTDIDILLINLYTHFSICNLWKGAWKINFNNVIYL